MATTKKASGSSKTTNANKGNKGLKQGGSQLEEFFVDSLKDIYWAEKHLTKALPKMQKAATTEQLQNVFEEHLAVTVEQVAKLEKVFGLLDKKPQAKKCEAMEGLIKEAQSIIEDTEQGTITRDVALIMAAQKVEHYEIASYGTLARLATIMGEDEVADILGEILSEEKEADSTLTEVAENNINVEAEQEGEEEPA